MKKNAIALRCVLLLHVGITFLSSCSPNSQVGLSAPSAGGSSGTTTLGNGSGVTIGGESIDSELEARLAACDLTEAETQDLEMCSQVIGEDGVWFNTCGDEIKTPVQPSWAESAERAKAPETREAPDVTVTTARRGKGDWMKQPDSLETSLMSGVKS